MRLTTLPPSSAVVMKSGNLNLLELSGPLQACNGTDNPNVTDRRLIHVAYIYMYNFHGATALNGPGLPHFRDFTITHRHITRGRTPLDE